MRIRVNGIPAPQGSKQRFPNGGMRESSKAVGPWREAIRSETQRILDGGTAERGPVMAEIVFYLPRPAYHWRASQPRTGELRPSAPKFPDHRPDLDKLVRAVLDGLTEGGAFGDDCQVVALAAVKGWASDVEPPGVLIELEPAS